MEESHWIWKNCDWSNYGTKREEMLMKGQGKGEGKGEEIVGAAYLLPAPKTRSLEWTKLVEHWSLVILHLMPVLMTRISSLSPPNNL